MEEEVVGAGPAVHQKPHGFPEETGYLSDSADEEQHFGPLRVTRVDYLELLHVVMHDDHACDDDEGDNVPVVFLLADLSLVVEHVQLHLQLHVGVVVLRQQPALTILHHEVVYRVVLHLKTELRFSCLPVKIYFVH